MAAVFREVVLEVSADLVRECPGLALDVGKSLQTSPDSVWVWH